MDNKGFTIEEILQYKYTEEQEKLASDENGALSIGMNHQFPFNFYEHSGLESDSSLVTNFSIDDELYYRKALENLNIQNYFEIRDTAYDMHGRLLPAYKSLHRKNSCTEYKHLIGFEPRFDVLKIFREIVKVEEFMKAKLTA